MKRLTWIASILAIAALGAVAQMPQTAAASNKGLIECLAELTTEVRYLRLEDREMARLGLSLAIPAA